MWPYKFYNLSTCWSGCGYGGGGIIVMLLCNVWVGGTNTGGKLAPGNWWFSPG